MGLAQSERARNFGVGRRWHTFRDENKLRIIWISSGWIQVGRIELASFFVTLFHAEIVWMQTSSGSSGNRPGWMRISLAKVIFLWFEFLAPAIFHVCWR